MRRCRYNCFSGFKQLFAEGQEFSYSLEDIGNYYVDYIKLMDHWDKVLPGFVLRVNHEDVVDNLEQEVRGILNFCGLPFEESSPILEPHVCALDPTTCAVRPTTNVRQRDFLFGDSGVIWHPNDE